MNGKQRPLSVTVIGWIYIGVGAIGFVYHLFEQQASGAFRYESVWIEAVRLLAVVCGAFILRGHSWARWVALAWIVFHVVLSAFRALPEFVMHLLFAAVIAWILFRPEAGRYFRSARIEQT